MGAFENLPEPAVPIVRSALALLLALSCTAALAQAQPKPATPAFEPESGQPGKDVVWVPTPQVVVDKMLELAKVTPSDFVMDLGSGDGRTVITAAKRGAKALGIEYNPDMVALSQRNAAKEGVTDRATFMKADLFETDFSRATVITMFLLPDINLKLRPKILAMKPGTRVASNTFNMGDWEPDESVKLTPEQGCNAYWCTAHLWIVPGRFEGSYKVAQGELVLKQQFQKLSGTLTAGGKTVPVTGKVRGDEFSLSTGAKDYHGMRQAGQLVLH